MHYRPESGSGGPSWLTLLGHMKDSLWSVDIFRCESLTLRTHWVLVVMDQFTRRIIGFGVHRGIVDGLALCSDVPASDTRTIVAEVSQHGQRSVVSVSPVAGEPSRAGGNGNQDGAVCASVAGLGFTLHLLGCNRR